jgi:fructokinase
MLIGIDWGGTKIEGVAMEAGGRELLRLRRETPRGDYRACLDTIRDMVGELEAGTGRTGTIGIGMPGSLEPLSRLGKGCSSTWVLGKPVERDLRAILGREIRVENDADCFAVSEAVDGAGADCHVVFAVILGSGAGAGIAVGGRAHHGPNNSAGEWGHNPLPFPDTTEIPGRPCYCGRHGCMETWVSGRAFEAEYERHTGESLRAGAIMERLRGGDRLAGLLWRAGSRSSSTPSTPTSSSWAGACRTSMSSTATCRRASPRAPSRPSSTLRSSRPSTATPAAFAAPPACGPEPAYPEDARHDARHARP